MSQLGETVVGIDVGEERKGFHAVALLDGHFVDKKADPDPSAIVDWCIRHKARVVAVDAPCRWSQSGSSRLVERQLGSKGIHCFATPTQEKARCRDFYKWVFNGERLYNQLQRYYHLFNGERLEEAMCIETFPHAVVCAMAGKVVPARPKSKRRREALRMRSYDVDCLPNIDFVDAALCAVVAEEFRNDRCNPYGDCAEGFILLPDSASLR